MSLRKIRVPVSKVDELMALLRAVPDDLTEDHLSEETRIGYALGILSPEERAQIDTHLAACPDCDEEIKRLCQGAAAWQGASGEQRLAQLRQRLVGHPPPGHEAREPGHPHQQQAGGLAFAPLSTAHLDAVPAPVSRLSPRRCYGRSPEPLSDFFRPRQLAAATTDRAPSARLYRSQDGRASAVVDLQRPGELVVTIDTQDAQLAQQRWGFRFVRPNHTELYRGEMALQAISGSLEPYWAGDVILDLTDWTLTDEPPDFEFYTPTDAVGDTL